MDDDANKRSSKNSGKSDKKSPKPKRPYAVGKGKPPVEHQFQPGQPSPNPKGRPKGSTKTNSLEKYLCKKAVVSHKNGKPVKKALSEVVDHRLVELAVNGDLNAIKLIKTLELQLMKAGLSNQPTIDEILKQRELEEEKKRLAEKISKSMVDYLNHIQSLKKIGLVEFVNGEPAIPKWAMLAAKAHQKAERENKGKPNLASSAD